nr:hypothetical protein [Luteimicrobium album]
MPSTTSTAICGHGDGHVVVGVHVAEGDVRLPRAPELLGVCVERVHEVVDDELQPLLLGGGDVHLVPGLLEPLVGVEDFERLRRVAGEDQDLGVMSRDVVSATRP